MCLLQNWEHTPHHDISDGQLTNVIFSHFIFDKGYKIWLDSTKRYQMCHYGSFLQLKFTVST